MRRETFAAVIRSILIHTSLILIQTILIQKIKVAFESIDVRGPEPAELSQPGIHLLKRFRLQAVETALCVHRGFDETGVAQHAQMLGHRRLRHAKPALDLSHRLWGREQEAQDRAAIRLGNDFERRFHWLDIPHRVYTCQGILNRESLALVIPILSQRTRKDGAP